MGDTFLDIRPSFELAAWFVTWAAVALLAVVAASLHARLRRLERGDSGREASLPFGQLAGRPFATGMTPSPRAVLVLSAGCAACARILEEAERVQLEEPLALVWTGGAPPPAIPAGMALLQDGARQAAELGIRVTPFALLLDGNGAIVRAAPVGTLEALCKVTGLSVRPAAVESYPRLLKEV